MNKKRRQLEVRSQFDDFVFREVEALREIGISDEWLRAEGVVYGWIRRYRADYSRFTIGFSPIADKLPGNVGEAISQSASAQIILRSTQQWTIGSNTYTVIPEFLKVNFCDEETETPSFLGRSNNMLNLIYDFDGRLKTSSNYLDFSAELYQRPEFLVNVLRAIQTVTRVDVVELPVDR